MSVRQKRDPIINSFPLPYEVFKLGLERGALLVYIYLVYYKSRKHCVGDLSCAVISKTVGLCEKTVRTHLRTLASDGLIQMANCGDSFSYTLCPIRGKVQARSSAEIFQGSEGGRSA